MKIGVNFVNLKEMLNRLTFAISKAETSYVIPDDPMLAIICVAYLTSRAVAAERLP